MREFRKLVRGSAANVVAELNKEKASISAEYNWLDTEAEQRELDDMEKARMKYLARELEKLWALDEIKAGQRSRDRIILERDRNTAYFHAVATARHRKKRIQCMNGPGGPIEETQEILMIASDFYKDLFKWESRGHFKLDSWFWDEEDKVTARKCRIRGPL
jgi:hypothetical protein